MRRLGLFFHPTTLVKERVCVEKLSGLVSREKVLAAAFFQSDGFGGGEVGAEGGLIRSKPILKH